MVRPGITLATTKLVPAPTTGAKMDCWEFPIIINDYALRSLSGMGKILYANGTEFRVDYESAESTSGLFGGNSNWRGPIWLPVNFLLIKSLQKFHHYLGDELKVECPSDSDQWMNLWEVATELSQRLTQIFLKNKSGYRPVYGEATPFQRDPHWRDLILFYEYFQGDNGAGIGASHQTGWTGLVAKLIQQLGEYEQQEQSLKLTGLLNTQSTTTMDRQVNKT